MLIPNYITKDIYHHKHYPLIYKHINNYRRVLIFKHLHQWLKSRVK